MLLRFNFFWLHLYNCTNDLIKTMGKRTWLIFNIGLKIKNRQDEKHHVFRHYNCWMDLADVTDLHSRWVMSSILDWSGVRKMTQMQSLTEKGQEKQLLCSYQPRIKVICFFWSYLECRPSNTVLVFLLHLFNANDIIKQWWLKVHGDFCLGNHGAKATTEVLLTV